MNAAIKCVTVHALWSYGEVSKAIAYIDEQHKLAGHSLKKLVFNREFSITVMQNEIEGRGIKLQFKAAGQKVGLTAVAIDLFVKMLNRQKLVFLLPANQFNVDFCIDTISVLNRTVTSSILYIAITPRTSR